jgi:hypothetical protein
MYNNHVQGVKTCTVDDMLMRAEHEWVNMTSSKKWIAKSTEGNHSIFFAGNCYGCGKPGHINKNCPLNKDKAQGGVNVGAGGRGYNRGGRGCGRDGRGSGRGRGGGRRFGQGSGNKTVKKDKSDPTQGR